MSSKNLMKRVLVSWSLRKVQDMIFMGMWTLVTSSWTKLRRTSKKRCARLQPSTSTRKFSLQYYVLGYTRPALGDLDYLPPQTDLVNFPFLCRTYQIRAVPTTTHDNILCILMAHAAVHGAYAGFTGFSSGPVNGWNVLLPLRILAGIQKTMDPTESMWQRLKLTTGQPDWVIPEEHKSK